MILSAREWGGFSWSNLKLVSGRMPQSGEEEAVVLGLTAADILKKKVGDPIQIETSELKVVGIVKGGALVEDGSVIMSLGLLQKILASPNQINAIDVRVTPGMNEKQMQDLIQQIQRQVPEVRAVTVADHLSNSEGFRMVRAMSWGTSLLAVLVGVLGVMNTMLMTVFERTHEICVLLAVGWKREPHYSDGALRVRSARIFRRRGRRHDRRARGARARRNSGFARFVAARSWTLSARSFRSHRRGRRCPERTLPGLAQFPPRAEPGSYRRVSSTSIYSYEKVISSRRDDRRIVRPAPLSPKSRPHSQPLFRPKN